jgi:hypothetical protein
MLTPKVTEISRGSAHRAQSSAQPIPVRRDDHAARLRPVAIGARARRPLAVAA